MILFKQLREKYSMSSKKVLTTINIICFIIFVIIQNLFLFLRIIDYSLDGSKGEMNDILLYIGQYLLISLIYLIPQALIILQGNKQKSKPNRFSKTIDKASKYLLTAWVVILFIQTFIIYIFAY
jgi:magnesium-transporting ATPase (P-type)